MDGFKQYSDYSRYDQGYYGTADLSRIDQSITYELDSNVTEVLNNALYKDVADEGLKQQYHVLQEYAGEAINENKKLKAQLEQTTQENLSLKTSLDEVTTQYQQAQQNITILLDQMKAADADIISLTDAHSKTQAELEAIHVELFNLREENKRIKSVETEHLEQIEKLTEELKEEKKERARFERKSQDYKRRLDVKTTEYDEIRDKLELIDEERNLYQAECIKGNLTGYNKPAGYTASDIYALKEDFKMLQEKSQLTSISFKSGKTSHDTISAASPDDSYRLLEKYSSEPSLATIDLTAIPQQMNSIQSAPVNAPPRPPKDQLPSAFYADTPRSDISGDDTSIGELFAKYVDSDYLKDSQSTVAKYSVSEKALESLLNKNNSSNEVLLKLTLNPDEAPSASKPSLLERQLRQEQYREMHEAKPTAELAALLNKYEIPSMPDNAFVKFGTASSRSTSHTLAMSLLGSRPINSLTSERYWTADQPLLTKYTAEHGF